MATGVTALGANVNGQREIGENNSIKNMCGNRQQK